MLGGRAPRTPATLGPARGVPEPGGSGARPGSRPTSWSQTAVAYILGKAPTKETNPIGADASVRGGAARLRWHGRWINKAPRVAGIAQQVRAPGCGPGGHRFDPGCSPQSFSHCCPSQLGAPPPRSEAYPLAAGSPGAPPSTDRQGRRCRTMRYGIARASWRRSRASWGMRWLRGRRECLSSKGLGGAATESGIGKDISQDPK
jgi:hypothetical protein